MYLIAYACQVISRFFGPFSGDFPLSRWSLSQPPVPHPLPASPRARSPGSARSLVPLLSQQRFARALIDAVHLC